MLNFKIEIFLFKLLFKIIEQLPLRVAEKIATILAVLNLHFIKIRLDIVKKQLMQSFPQKSLKEIKKLTKQIFLNFAKNAVEFCWFSRKTLPEKLEYVSIKGYQNIKKALSYKKGLIIFMGHLGNWELAAQIIGMTTKKLSAVAKQQRNLYFDKFVNDIRNYNHIHLIPKGLSLRGILESLKKNHIILMLGDQNAGRKGKQVSFMGRKASTNLGTAKIALKFQCPVIFSACIRKGNKYHLFFEKPILRTSKENFDADVLNFTKQLTLILEKWVKNYPDQWFWLHRRWKR